MDCEMLTTISLIIIHHHTKLVSFLVMRMFKIRSLSESKVAQSCLTLCDPMDCSLPGSSIHGIFLGKSTGVGCHFLLQGVFPIRDRTRVSRIVGRRFTIWATREAQLDYILSNFQINITILNTVIMLDRTSSWLTL